MLVEVLLLLLVTVEPLAKFREKVLYSEYYCFTY